MNSKEAIKMLRTIERTVCLGNQKFYEAIDVAIKALEQPTVEPERKRGKWIDNETSYADGVRQTCTCSICGQRSVRPLGRFCRWCGADMRGENDDIPIEYFESGGK